MLGGEDRTKAVHVRRKSFSVILSIRGNAPIMNRTASLLYRISLPYLSTKFGQQQQVYQPSSELPNA
eukprot:scaffold249376_cov67-Cyclotella_meneghiniana.AAC.1